MDHLTFGTIRRAFGACGASVEIEVRGRGGEFDRLLDAKHAELVQAVGRYLAEHGWTCWFEVTYSHFGERGSIDVLAVRGDAVLVVEVESELTSVEATLRKLDEKARLAAKIVFERTGRRPLVAGRLLVLPDASTPRRQVARLRVVFDAALPARGVMTRAWVKRPSGPFAGILFLSPAPMGRGGKPAVRLRQRVRRESVPAGRGSTSMTGSTGT